MNKNNKSKFTVSSDNKNILNEIKSLLIKLIGLEEITFNQFGGILDKDNQVYNRNVLLYHRRNFFKEREEKRSKRNSKEIKMPIDSFVNFLDSLMRKGALDLERFRKTVIYCLKSGIIVGK